MANIGQRTVKVIFGGDARGVTRASKQGSEAVGGFGRNMDRLSVGILGATAVIGGALVTIGGQFDDAYDKIRVGTGAIGGRLDGLKQDFREVAREVPASFDDVSTAVTLLNQRLGVTGKGLQGLAVQEIRLAQLTGQDLTQVIDNTTRMFGDWSIATDKQGDALDHLFRAGQATGTGIDKLTNLVVQFGAPLRQLGFSFDQSITLLGKWNKEGVNTELVLGGLKKALGTFAKQGKDPVVALQNLITSLKNAKTTMEANKIAVAQLGVKAGPDFAAAVREGRFKYEDLLQTVQGGTDTIKTAADDTDDWKESLQKLKNDALITVEPLALSLFDTLSTKGIPALEGVVGWTKDHEGATKALTTALLVTAGAVVTINALHKAYIATSAAVIAITDGWALAQWALNVAMYANPIGLVILAIGAIILGVGLIIKGLEGLGISWDDIWGGIKNTVKSVWGWISEKTADQKRMWIAFGDTIKGVFKTAFNWVAKLYNNTIGKISLHIPDWVPGIGGHGFDVKPIPLMAKGGPVRAGRPYIVGDAGPELFFPGQSGSIASNQDSAAWAGEGGDVIVLADFGDGVRQIVKAERVSAGRATREYVKAAAA